MNDNNRSKELLKVLKNHPNIELLTAKCLASEINTSQSTISRIVKELGYRNFNELKYSLINRGADKVELSDQEEIILAANISTCELLKTMMSKKIALVGKRRFNGQVLFIGEYLRIKGIEYTYLTSANQSVADFDVIIHLGKLENVNQDRDKYIQIYLSQYEFDLKQATRTIILKNIPISKHDEINHFNEITMMQNYLLFLISVMEKA